jgi:hypothetical protein
VASNREKENNNSSTVLISGGLDCKLCVYSVDDFAKKRPNWILPVPAAGLIQSSVDQTIFAMMHNQHIDIWKVGLQHVVTKNVINKKAKETKVLKKVNFYDISVLYFTSLKNLLRNFAFLG